MGNETELIENEPAEIIEVSTPEIAREVATVRTRFEVAIKFPRKIGTVHDEIMESCKIKSLAQVAEYCLPISGRSITGPSVRIAEVILQSYGNAEMATVLVHSEKEFGVYESYFIDFQKNIKKTVRYKIEYTRYSKAGGHKKLEDHSDIKRAVNRISALHERDCLFKCVPRYIVDDALEQCRKTLSENGGTLAERIKKMVTAFSSLQAGKVTREDLEERLGGLVEEMSLENVLEYGRIFNSLSEGASKKADWFKSAQRESADLSGVNAPLNLAANKDAQGCSKAEKKGKAEQKQEYTTTSDVAETKGK